MFVGHSSECTLPVNQHVPGDVVQSTEVTYQCLRNAIIMCLGCVPDWVCALHQQPRIPPHWTAHVQDQGGVYWWCPPDVLHMVFSGLAKTLVQRVSSILVRSRRVRPQEAARALAVQFVELFSNLGVYSCGTRLDKASAGIMCTVVRL